MNIFAVSGSMNFRFTQETHKDHLDQGCEYEGYNLGYVHTIPDCMVDFFCQTKINMEHIDSVRYEQLNSGLDRSDAVRFPRPLFAL